MHLASVKCLPLTEPSLRRSKDTINFLHNAVGPLHGGCNHCFRLRAPPIVEQVFGRLEMTGDQNPSDDCQHTFASLFREGILALSPFVRLNRTYD